MNDFEKEIFDELIRVGYTPDQAQDFFEAFPNQARELVQKIKAEKKQMKLFS